MSQTEQVLPRSAFQVQCDVIFALYVRELKTRFGEFQIGSVWALAEPVVHTAIMIAVHSARGSLRGMNFPVGVDIPIFYINAVVPFFLFRSTIMLVMRSISSNRGLYFYRQVKPIDSIISRTLLEVSIYTVVFCILLLAGYLVGYNVQMYDPLGFIAIYAIWVLFMFGLGIIICVTSTFFKEIETFVPLTLLPLYLISAVLFPMTSVPQEYWYLLTWNPILHIEELLRTSFFQNYNTPVGSVSYVLAFAVGFLGFGLALYRATVTRLVSSQ